MVNNQEPPYAVRVLTYVNKLDVLSFHEFEALCEILPHLDLHRRVSVARCAFVPGFVDLGEIVQQLCKHKTVLQISF